SAGRCPGRGVATSDPPPGRAGRGACGCDKGAFVFRCCRRADRAAVEMNGRRIGTDMHRHWKADAAFFDQLRDREVLLAVVGEVAGAEVAAANASEKTKALKAIISDCVAGENGRAKAEPWVPQWMAFPPTAYTSRGGVGSVKSAARVAFELSASIVPLTEDSSEPESDDPPLAA
ncbi:MAG: hypothetical protein Q7T73_12795, partial [Beijerinckiaceae bacterium]|nr:hypothetical protein [Beijerinckiaceae bacterium]